MRLRQEIQEMLRSQLTATVANAGGLPYSQLIVLFIVRSRAALAKGRSDGFRFRGAGPRMGRVQLASATEACRHRVDVTKDRTRSMDFC